MHVIKRTLLLLPAVFAFLVMTAASASAFHPLFLTQSKNALPFTGTSGLALLRFAIAGNESLISCEKDAISGELLDNASRARKVELEFSGKCLENGSGTCIEPIKIKLALGELGLASSTSKRVLLLLAPESGTTFATIECSGSMTIEGAVIGEIPELNKSGEVQYNKDRKNFELIFRSANKNQHQAINEILLLGTQMTGVELKIPGFFGGDLSVETVETLTTDGEALIDTK